MSKGVIRCLAWVCLFAVPQLGCSARAVGPSAPSEPCTSGRTESCTCADGLVGVRLCQSDQTFTACACSATPDGGTDVAPPPDAPADDVRPVDPPDVTMDVVATDVAPPDVARPDAAVDAPRVYPPPPYGSRVCARFEPFTLNTCEGAPWNFAQDDFFTSTATVVLVCAGWNVPCQMQAGQIESVLSPYQARGVRVVEVLVQNPDRATITASFCATWRARYHLTIPVVMDPSGVLSPYYPGLALPANIVIDGAGRIRYRGYGSDTGLSSITAALDEALSAPDTCTP